MMVARDMVGEPARRGVVLAGLGLAGSIPFLAVSLGRVRVIERHLNDMISCIEATAAGP
jgi:hypothetical protein